MNCDDSSLVHKKFSRHSIRICSHELVREIGYDNDEEGRLLMLVRCEMCGLLMRKHLADGSQQL